MSICNSTFTLKEIDIIGGDYQEITFNISDSATIMDVSNLQLHFSLVEYKNRYGTPLISRNCQASADKVGAFLVVLNPEDTKDYTGKFIYQITVKAPNNKQKSFQGIMTIEKNIDPNAFSNAATE